MGRKIKVRYVILIIIFLGLAVIFCRGWSWNERRQERMKNRISEQIVQEDTEYRYRENLVNILVMGIDKEEKMWERDDDGNSVGQADTVFVVSLDLTTEKIRLVAFPRDTMVPLSMYSSEGEYMGSRTGQLALQYAYADGQEKSCQLTQSRVSDILGGIPLYGYLALNLSTISIINDAVGGVVVTMEEDYTVLDSLFVKGATLRLQGQKALCYLQNRDITVQGSAYTRIGRQKTYMKAFLEQARMAMKKNPLLPLYVLKELEGNYVTDLQREDIVWLVLKALSCSFSEEEIWVLPGNILQAGPYEEYWLDTEAVTEGVLELFYEQTGAEE